MNRSDKKDWISSLNSALVSSESAIVAKFNALTVAEMSELRHQARELGIILQRDYVLCHQSRLCT